jgi:hypothetical protein
VVCLEAYCDVCDLPAPKAVWLKGKRGRQNVRQLFAQYWRELSELGWARTRSGHEYCRTCAAASGVKHFVGNWAKLRPAAPAAEAALALDAKALP